MSKKIILLIVAIIIIVAGLFIIYRNKNIENISNTNVAATNQAAEKLVVVKHAAGAGLLIGECADKNYISQTAEYIVEGTVEKSEAKQNEEDGLITTYVDFSIEKYIKGTSFGNELQLQVGGGCVGDICQWVEDEASFIEGAQLKLNFAKEDGEYWIICGENGVENLSE